jgi:hypothetical protein
MKIYLAGSISNRLNAGMKLEDIKEDFRSYERKLSVYGNVYNPIQSEMDPDKPWSECMCRHLTVLLNGGFTHMFVMPQSSHSTGVSVEIYVASVVLKIPVLTSMENLDD